MEPRESRYAIPLATLVAGASVPVTEQVVLVDDDPAVRWDGGGGGGVVDGDGD